MIRTTADRKRSSILLAMAAMGWLAGPSIVHSQDVPPVVTQAVVIYVPRAGAPTPATLRAQLRELPGREATLNVALLPAADPGAAPTCPLPIAARLERPDATSREVFLTLSASALSCGGGRHTVGARVTAREPGQEGRITFTDFTIPLSIRFEPAVEFRPASPQVVTLGGLTCWLCWPAGIPRMTRHVLPVTSEPQIVEVQNNSIGSVTLTPTLEGSGADLAFVTPQRPLAPGETARLRVSLKADDETRPGAHDRRLLVRASEANVEAPVERAVSIPVKLNFRIGAAWLLLAMLAGYVVGRAIGVLQDPGFAAKVAFHERLEKIEYHARAIGRWDGDAGVGSEVRKLASLLDFSNGIPKALADRLEALEASLGAQFAAAPLPSRAAAEVDPGIEGKPGFLARVRRMFGWLIGMGLPPVRFGADVIRPLVRWAIILVGFGSGLKIFYVDAPTFGAGGVLDLLPVMIWAATTMAVAQSFDALSKK